MTRGYCVWGPWLRSMKGRMMSRLRVRGEFCGSRSGRGRGGLRCELWLGRGSCPLSAVMVWPRTALETWLSTSRRRLGRRRLPEPDWPADSRMIFGFPWTGGRWRRRRLRGRGRARRRMSRSSAVASGPYLTDAEGACRRFRGSASSRERV